MAYARANSSLSAIRAACSGLMALLLVSLLGLAQQQAMSAAASGGAGISVARQGDQVALLRITGKTQALEIRAGRALPVKFLSSGTGALAPATLALLVDQVSPIQAVAAPAAAHSRQASSNQPRAPPFA
ncbi:hypothetical protein RFM23_06310 [Mesorhizobium abyssinicae]|uniref:Uncharacterized protein n=1 Tax=Mesorhizobium abyssinicae TaxID=1209958 RepID=A0ABU5AIZ1_9HYPH|nr:hypothetical protein [Mesorhizobium abyssinicae]MDX8537233.1 hypothetical protein [Mesorhizobium abyssinicae]